MADEILSELDGPLRIITLNRPDVHNAMNGNMTHLFQDVLFVAR